MHAADSGTRVQARGAAAVAPALLASSGIVYSGGSMNTRTIAVIALILVVILILFLVL